MKFKEKTEVKVINFFCLKSNAKYSFPSQLTRVIVTLLFLNETVLCSSLVEGLILTLKSWVGLKQNLKYCTGICALLDFLSK